MKKLFLLALFASTPAIAQVGPPTNVTMLNGQPRAVTPGAHYCFDNVVAAWTPCPAFGAAVRESFPLVAVNTPSPAATVFGGDYILSQTCASYGTLALQILGPDGTTWLTLLTKTASDNGNGTGLSLGSFAQVRVTVSGTAGCNSILARVPS